MKPRALILMYHRVARAGIDPWWMCVSPENFAAQLQAIKQFGTPMSLADFARGQKDGVLPERPIVVTFDDGYVDNFEVALPLLRQYQVPATVFITTHNIDTRREFWWDRLESILLTPGQLPDKLTLDLPAGDLTWALEDASSLTIGQLQRERDTAAWRAAPGTRLRFFHDVWKALWPLAHDLREIAIDKVADWAGRGAEQPSTRRTMSSSEISSMAEDALVTIGAHTVHHLPLSAHSFDEQSRQIRDSQICLQQIIGKPVTAFAYPHGEYSPATVGILQASGFECAVTTSSGPAPIAANPMLLPRIGIRDVSGNQLLAQLDALFGRPV
jgi:peptidoglycan/xylan/chitin deacetylase (PgdA/CDA1 family)